jgi:hypothetical protein
MKSLFALSFLLMTAGLSAQPAKDLYDAQQAAKQHERDVFPAVQLARETAGVLRLFLQVETTLGNANLPAGSAIDRAVIQMEEYERELDRRRGLLPTDVRKRIGMARAVLEELRLRGPADLTAGRDKWHHEVVHPMARRVAEDAQAINALIATYTNMENNLRQIQSTELGVLANAENVPGLPQGTPRP